MDCILYASDDDMSWWNEELVAFSDNYQGEEAWVAKQKWRSAMADIMAEKVNTDDLNEEES
jgi:hypothetical protein